MNLGKAQRRLILVLGMAIAIGPMSIDMYLPALPTLAQELGASPGAVQWTLATFFLGLCLGQLVYGPLSDRYGRRRPLQGGLALYVLASLGCALAQDVAQLQVLRGLQAMGGAAAMVVTRAVVRDLFDPQTGAKVFSLLMLVMGLAPILAPLVGGYVLLAAGWRTIFVLLAAFGGLCLLALWRTLPETARPPPAGAGGYGSVLRHRQFLGHAFGGGLAQAGMFAYIAGSPFVFIELYRLPAQHFGWLFGLNAFGLIAAAQLNRRLLNRRPMTQLLSGAVSVHTAAAVCLLAVALLRPTALWMLALPLFVAIASLGLVFPNASAAALAPFPKQAGRAAAALGIVQYGCAGLAAALVGALPATSAVPMAAVIAGCAAASFGLLRWLAPLPPTSAGVSSMEWPRGPSS